MLTGLQTLATDRQCLVIFHSVGSKKKEGWVTYFGLVVLLQIENPLSFQPPRGRDN